MFCNFLFCSHGNENSTSSKSQTKKPASQLVYNANRYSPKTTTRGPTASSAMYNRSNRTFTRRKTRDEFDSIEWKFLVLERHNRTKRQTNNSSNTTALRALHHSQENNTRRLTTISKGKNKEQQSSIGTSNRNQNREYCSPKKTFRHSNGYDNHFDNTSFSTIEIKKHSLPSSSHGWGWGWRRWWQWNSPENDSHWSIPVNS